MQILLSQAQQKVVRSIPKYRLLVSVDRVDILTQFRLDSALERGGIKYQDMGDLLARIQTTKANDGLFPVRPDYGDQRVKNSVLLRANYSEMNLHNPDLVLCLCGVTF